MKELMITEAVHEPTYSIADVRREGTNIVREVIMDGEVMVFEIDVEESALILNGLLAREVANG